MRILGKFVKSVKLASFYRLARWTSFARPPLEKFLEYGIPEPWTIGAMDSGRWEVE